MQNLAIIYGAVIDDVLSKVRSDFVQEGNEPVVEELRALWEEKLLHTGVLDLPTQEEYQEPVKEEANTSLALGSSFGYQQALNVPHNTASHQHHPHASIYATGQQYLQQQQQQQYSQSPLPSVHQGHLVQPSLSTHVSAQPNIAYRMQQPLVLNQQAYSRGLSQPLQQPHSNIADGRKRKAESLQVPYGVNITGPPQKQERLLGPNHPQSQMPGTSQGIPQIIPPKAPAQAIPQQDGPADDTAPSPEGTSLDNLSDVELDDDAIEGKMLPDFILGQYELVKRIKNRWKCTLNHAVMHLNGQDVVVTKAQGELTF
ncbi:Transcription initiation factor IIA subunit 1 [Trebouxia sp. C0009 RCD-2024]